MAKKRTIAGLILTGAAFTGVFLYAQSAPPPSHLDTQHLLLENAVVRVYDIRVPPGVTEPKHSHGRGITIAMSDYDNETTTYPDNKHTAGHTAFGDVKWVEPVTHEAHNTGKTEQHVVRIELK